MQNHVVERMWEEFNSRVNYPIKQCLTEMENDHVIDMVNDTHKFCVSWVTIRVANVGTTIVIKSWNNHRIPSKFHNMYLS